jgi:chromosome segregation ATPase
MASFASANRMTQMAAALASPNEESTAKALSLYADLLAENASLGVRVGLVEQQLQAAGEERIHAGIKVIALESVIKERDASIEHLVGLRETANSKLDKATAELSETRTQMSKLQSLTESDQEQRADILTTISTLEHANSGLKSSLEVRTDQRDTLQSTCDDLRAQIAHQAREADRLKTADGTALGLYANNLFERDDLRAQIAMLAQNQRRHEATLRHIPHWMHLPGEPVDHDARLRSRGYTAEEVKEITDNAEWHGRCLNPPAEYFSNFPDSDSDGEGNNTDVDEIDERGCVTRP